MTYQIGAVALKFLEALGFDLTRIKIREQTINTNDFMS